MRTTNNIDCIPDVRRRMTILNVLVVLFIFNISCFLLSELLILITPDATMKICFKAINIFLIGVMTFVITPAIYFENKFRFFSKIKTGK